MTHRIKSLSYTNVEINKVKIGATNDVSILNACIPSLLTKYYQNEL